ncbi:hypothetical protein [Pedobacter frigiditerrae]|nr:hypothetical protein [Pedobacter frigiditerrae]
MKRPALKVYQNTLFIYKSIKNAKRISPNDDTTGTAKTTLTSTGFFK